MLSNCATMDDSRKKQTKEQLVNHTDHVNLIKGGIPQPGGVWADIGSGTGAFTLALAEIIGPTGQIVSIDKDRAALQRQERLMQERFPQTAVFYHLADYTKQLDLPPLGGIVMANTLHFHRGNRRAHVLQLMHSYLPPGGRLILVEYDTDRGNHWVPYPISFKTWQTVARATGFTNTILLATRPSRFLGQIYAAVSIK